MRNCLCVVYDVTGFVEEMAASSGQIGEHSWLARSFRVAEQFVLARAHAVVVHSAATYDGALRRGAQESDLFLIEPLLAPAVAAQRYDEAYRHAYAQRKSGGPHVQLPHLQPSMVCL